MGNRQNSLTMSDHGPSVDARPPSATEIVQTTPKGGTRSYDEMNTGQMVFELQGTVGELKESIASLTRIVEKGFSRVDGIEHSVTDIKDTLRALLPKLEDLVGFTKYRVPALAEKSDLVKAQAELKAEIDKRPTRRQMALDVVMVVGAIGTVLTIGSRLAH